MGTIVGQRFDILNTKLDGLRIIERKPIGDSRGYLERLFCLHEFKELLDGKIINQINHTHTKKSGTVRGLHFQYPPHSETKFITCIKGEVFDVAVDIRSKSSGFFQYHAEILTADNRKTLVIPEGFAHGFQTLTDDCEMLYFHTAPYVADSEGGLNALDPLISIQWPRVISDQSEKDKNQSMLLENFKGLNYEL